MQRHKLSEIFGDISGEAYNALREDIARNGFVNAEILTYENHILDGWHRYCIAKEFDMVEDLVFKDVPGDGIGPVMRVLSNNLYRGHLSASQRAQVVVEAYEWYERGEDRRSDGLNVLNGTMKTKKELAEIANVGTTTIARAKKVSRAGFAEAVISGEKTASQIIKEEKSKDTLRQREDLTNNTRREGFYPTIAIALLTDIVKELEKIDLPLTDDALVLVWASEQNAPDPFKFIKTWGLTDFFTMTVEKAEGIKDHYATRFNDAFIFIGSKGSSSPSIMNKLVATFQAARDKRAVEIDMFYDMIRRETDTPRLAISNHSEINGFDVWKREVSKGNETSQLRFSAM